MPMTVSVHRTSKKIPTKKLNNYVVENNAVNKNSISMKLEIEDFLRQPSSWGRMSTMNKSSLMGENVAARVREVKDLRKQIP
jgi:hypothetical protein